jgi:predicted RecA/RadA family phage recombinase
MARISAVTLVVLFGLGCGSDGDDGTTPHIDSLSPTSGKAGDTVEIVGENFCGASEVEPDGLCNPVVNGFVTFGTAEGVTRGQVQSWKDTVIQVKVPGGGAKGAVQVTATVNGVASNAVDFTVN